MGTYKSLVMFFGICNSLSTFQTMMNNIFNDMHDIIVVYINNILVSTHNKSSEKHAWIVEQVLQQLKEHNLYVKPSKCSFNVSEVEYLDWWVSKDGVWIDGRKLKAIHDWPTLTTLKGVHSFLGATGFYRHFIENYASVAKPLIDITKKDTPFVWSSQYQAAFAHLNSWPQAQS